MKNFYVLLILFFANSCATKKDVIYDLSHFDDGNNFGFSELLVQKGDVLDIKIHSVNPETILVFQSNPGQFQNQQPDMLKLQGYLVNSSGQINFPVLGVLNVDGLSTTQVSHEIEKGLAGYFKDLTVRTRIVNYKISVLGEVARPGTYTYLEEQVTLPQVLGTAGDLTINGDRNNITIVRKVGDELKTYSINLSTGGLTNPDTFYLQQNDLVYVPPNMAKIKSAGIIGNVGTLVSVLSLMLSLTILITRY